MDRTETIRALVDSFLENPDSSADAIVERNADLMPELGEQLRIARLLKEARQRVTEEADAETTAAFSPGGSGTELSSGTSFGDFVLVEQIGAGGMGLVFLARQKSVARDVALKFLGRVGNTSEGLARFKREAQAAAKLRHPGIASIYFLGQDNGMVYMAMEYVAGKSLMEVISTLRNADSATFIDQIVISDSPPSCDRPINFLTEHVTIKSNAQSNNEFPITKQAAAIIQDNAYIRRCCELVRDCALALEYAHTRDVIHRDIKPSNIMVDEEKQIRIIDFGLARYVDDQTLTQSGMLVGTPLYMSPEQVAGRSDVDSRSDVYSLGIVLYELLTLAPAISAPSREGLFTRIITKQLVPLTWENPAVPVELESVVHCATQKDPDERYPRMEDFAKDLDAVLRKGHVVASRYKFKHDASELLKCRPPTVGYLAAVWGFYGIIGWSVLLVAVGSWSIDFSRGNSIQFEDYSSGAIGLLLAIVATWIFYGLWHGKMRSYYGSAILGTLLCLLFLSYSFYYLATSGDSAAVKLSSLIVVALFFLPQFGLMAEMLRTECRDWFQRVRRSENESDTCNRTDRLSRRIR